MAISFQRLHFLIKLITISWFVGILLIASSYIYLLIKNTSLISNLFWPVVFFCIFYFGILINIATSYYGEKISKIAKSRYKTYLDFTSLEKTDRLDNFLNMVSDPEIDELAKMYFLFIKLALVNFMILFLNIIASIIYT